jgi:nicotinate phosphoribosyltransferase
MSFIINSLLDTDFYIFTMGQAVLHQFPGTTSKFRFKCRNEAKWTQEMVDRLTEHVQGFCNLKFTEEELNYLSSIRFLKSDYIDFLRLYHPQFRHITIELKGTELQISYEGPLYQIIYYEVPLLAMVNEIYFIFNPTKEHESGLERLKNKAAALCGSKMNFRFSDFSTRRRHSFHMQERVVKTFAHQPHFSGTSNVYFAMKYGITPIGTMAHLWLQIGQASNVRLIDSQKYMLQKWVDEYRGDLGIALTDIVGSDAFIRDFDLYFAKLYDGVRHDSGDPFEWGEKFIKHYESLNIDPFTKVFTWSDGLDVWKALDLAESFGERCMVNFGIGTHFSNDFPDIIPLQIVIKMIECNGQPVAKLSDSGGKAMCEDPQYEAYLKSVFRIGDK